MDKQYLYNFRIGGSWKPATLPMIRLAEYLAQLATLFDHKDHVHFLKLLTGSVTHVMAVDPGFNAKVMARLKYIGNPDAPKDLIRAYEKINGMVREDGASASLRRQDGVEILKFKGVKTVSAEEIVLHEVGELDGVVIKVGGKDDSIPVLLEGENRQFYQCNTKRAIAKQLAGYLFEQAIRVHGRGKWRRTPEGEWELEEFNIQSFEPLDETPLTDIIAKLRLVKGSGWNELADSHAELKKIRGE